MFANNLKALSSLILRDRISHLLAMLIKMIEHIFHSPEIADIYCNQS